MPSLPSRTSTSCANASGAGLRILAEASSSPTLAAQKARLLAEFPQAVWHEYEPISRDNERAGSHLAFGKEKTYRTQLAFEKAKVILCLDADPIGGHPAAVEYIRGFAKGRERGGGHDESALRGRSLLLPDRRRGRPSLAVAKQA